MLIIFLLSLFTFYLVEKPFWKNNKKRFINYIIIFCFLFLNLKVHLIYNQFVKPKETALNLNSAPWDDLKNEKNEICYSKQNNFCTFQKENNKKIFIVGDSILGTLQSGLVKRLKAEDYSVTIMTSNDCFYAPNFNYIYLNTNKTHPKCSHKYQQTRQEILKKQEKAIIILGGNLPVYLSNKFYFKNNKNNENKTYDKRFVNVNNKKFYNDVQTSIRELSNKNYVILLYPVIEPGYNVPRYIESKLSKFSSKEEMYQLSLKSIEKEKKISQRMAHSKNFFDGIKGKNIFRVYPQKIICKNSKCSFFNKDNIYYIDEAHPSKIYANKINDKILEKIFKIFNKSN
ncbi:MAG: hypothetical protein MRY23_06225 [Pelagibacteraceae bacterium]|nr:hypothetical protein [Pelagibacteraceae bacterium]MCI5078826.1 hypothetical protein [Pelagibacteraceae bacterium]